MNTTKTLATMVLALAAATTGCYSGEGTAQSVDDIRIGNHFWKQIPGNWTALTQLSCAANGGSPPQTMTVNNCTITYVNKFCREVQTEGGGWDCICDAEITGLSGVGCGDVRL